MADRLEWRSACGSGTCVEVGEDPATGLIHVRDSKQPNRPPLSFTRAEWGAFIAAVQAGQLGLP